MKIELIDINKIIPYERNPRINDEAVKCVANSIRSFGFQQPIVIDKDNVIIAGHTRYKASLELELKKVPCVIAKDLDEEQIKAYRIADNSTGEVAVWDFDMLKLELDDIQGYDFAEFGLTLESNEEEQEIEIFEDTPPEVNEENTICKEGELWKLGNHFLLCADSTKEENLKRLLDGQIIDLYLTDPPYNVDYEGGNGKKIENDNMDDESFLEFLTDMFTAAYEFIKPGGAFYIYHADSEGLNFRKATKSAGFMLKQTLIWVKNSLVLGRQDYQWQHEPILYGWKPGAAHYFIDDRTNTTVFEDKTVDIAKLKKDEAIALLKEIYSDKISTTIIREDKPSKSSEHPTMKPIKLLARNIKNSSKIGEVVFDSCGGSGSTLIACQQLGRRCYTTELSPNYCDVIISRFENLTGIKAVKISDTSED